MDWDSTRHKVKKIAFLFCGAAIVAITANSIEHLSFGIMGGHPSYQKHYAFW